ncbi:MAG: dipeptidase [Caulobacteraceae bacterium]
MKLIDLHCDTVLRFVECDREMHLKKNDICIDIEKMRKACSLAQFFAMYVDYGEFERPMDKCLEMIDRFYREIEDNSGEIAYAGSFADMEKNKKNGKISAFLAVEEGGVIEGKLYNLRNLYRLGVRLITLTWNYSNGIGHSNFQWTNKDKGLTPLGEEVVAEMNRLGMIIDVSHLSDQGFYDVARLSGKPFIASHSNARAVQDHSRNLTDEMLKILAEKGGITGLNLEADFLGDEGRVEAMVRHIKHIKRVAGIDVMAIGTDFDGTTHLTAIRNIGEMEILFEALKKEGFRESELDKVMYGNAVRVIKAVMG